MKLKKLLWFLLPLGLLTAGIAYGVNVTIPQSTQKGNIPVGNANGTYNSGFLVAGTNITIGTSTTGQITINSSGGGSSVSTTSVQSIMLPLIANGTVAGVNATSSATSFLVQGTVGLNPFVVSSSTGTALLTVTQAGNVGIGTTTPAFALTLAQATTSAAGISLGGDVNLFRAAANTLALRNGTGSAPQSFRLYNTYTDDANTEYLEMKSVAGSSYLFNSVGLGSGSARGICMGSGGNCYIPFDLANAAIGPIAQGGMNGASHPVFSNTATWNNAATSFDNILGTITNTTSSPNSSLIRFNVGGSDVFKVGVGGSGYFAGNVGIGTTSPSSKLTLDDGGSSAVSLKLQNASNPSTYNTTFTQNFSASDTFDITTTGLNWLRYTFNGSQLSFPAVNSFQIGAASTTLPTGKLTVASSQAQEAAQIVIQNTPSASLGQRSTIAFVDGVNNFYTSAIKSQYLSATSGQLEFYAANTSTTTTPQLVINGTSGNVGIGTTTPNAKLFVQGSFGLYPTVIPLATTTYTIATSTDSEVFTSTTTAASTITLPACVGGTIGVAYKVFDGGGSASTANITVTRSASDTLNGATTKIINGNYDGMELRCYTVGKWQASKLTAQP
jgi:hypothetical protein